MSHNIWIFQWYKNTLWQKALWTLFPLCNSSLQSQPVFFPWHNSHNQVLCYIHVGIAVYLLLYISFNLVPISNSGYVKIYVPLKHVLTGIRLKFQMICKKQSMRNQLWISWECVDQSGSCLLLYYYRHIALYLVSMFNYAFFIDFLAVFNCFYIHQNSV